MAEFHWLLPRRAALSLLAALVLLAGQMALINHQAAAGPVYKSKDAQGNTVYSDLPPRGQQAKPVTLGAGNNYTPPEVTFKAPPAAPEEVAPAEFAGYQKLAILTPTADATVHDNEGKVPLSFALDPTLQPGNNVQVLLDGRVIANAASTNGVGALTNVDRGTHEIRLEVRDTAGKVLIQSSPVTFHMLRTSVLLGPTAQGTKSAARRAAGATNNQAVIHPAPHASTPIATPAKRP